MGHKGPRALGGYGVPEDFQDEGDEYAIALDGRTAGMDERLRRLEGMMHVRTARGTRVGVTECPTGSNCRNGSARFEYSLRQRLRLGKRLAVFGP